MRIAIMGHFGGNKKFNDGQTVKTIAIYNALKRYGIRTVHKVDTYYIRRNPICFLWQFFCAIIQDRKFVVLLSDKGRKIMFPILYRLSVLGKHIYHYGIGGRLAREVSNNKNWRKYVSAFKGNWMESKELVDKLQLLGVKNAIYIPNFKKLRILNEDELAKCYQNPFRLCTFSRVMKEKGIEDAIQVVQEINKEAHKQLVTLDIYGPGEGDYLNKLNGILERTDACKYCGVIDADKSVETIKDYYALLFPTHWRHEGIPGTIIDSMSAGVPVIARRWQYCDEMIQEGYNGYVYDFEHPEMLKGTIKYAFEHVEETVAMKTNCIKVAHEYSEESVIQEIVHLLEAN